MKSKHLLLLLLMAVFAPWAAQAQESLPYTEGFENMSSADDLTAAGWISYQSQSGSFLAIETAEANVHTGEKALDIDSWNASSSSAYVIVGLPTVDAAINGLQITFSYKVSTGNVYVGYLTNADDASTFVQLGAYTNSSSYTTVTKELNQAPDNAARIAIKYLNYYRCYIDDIEVKALPNCKKPNDLEVTAATTTSVTLGWTNGDEGQDAWQICLNDDEEHLIDADTNPFTVEGLEASTTYTVKVRANCGNEEYSDWSNPITIATACEATDAEGYSENFDAYTVGSSYSAPTARVLPDCWKAINTTTYSTYSVFPSIYYYSYTNYASSTPNCLKFYSAYSTYTNYDPQPQYAILPPMEGLAGMQVTLKARGYNATSTFKIGTMSNPMDASTFTMIAEQDGLTTSYQEFEYIVPFNCTDSYLAIMIEAATTTTAIGVYIDDIVITEAPSCIKPTGLEVTNVTTQTADISWTAGGNETQWQVAIKEGTDDWEIFPTIFDNNSGQLQGLTPATTYQVKVRAYCSDTEQSEWSTEKSFDTPCDVITVTDSWSENFNSLTAGIPNCWDNSEGTTSTESYKWNYYATGHDGAGLRFNSYNNSNGYTNFLKTPTLNFATGKVMQLTFWYKNPTGGDFSVYISTDGGNTYTTALATGLTGASSWTLKEIDLTNYVDAENVVIVFKGTSNYGNGDAYIYLDDVAVVQAPSCIKPTGLAVTEGSITSDGAVITWTAGGSETNWQIEFATNANFTNPLYETVTGEPTYTFHGLDNGTTYFVHVQAVCGGSDGSSEYSLPVSFTTLQLPANLPYATDFENENGWLLVNGNLTNAWAYGEGTSNGEGTHALYISNDGGITNAYSTSSTAMVYATKLFNFEAGTYVFSYNWKAYGESTYDYLRVALVPSSVTLTAGTIVPSVPSGYFYNNLPTGWIALDGGGKLNLKSDWQSFASDEIEITTAGTYMMVFAWRNDGGGGSNPPAAIDNVSIEVITCTTPTGLTAPQSGITATSAQLSWTETGEATAWEIELTDADDNVSIIPVEEEDLVEGVFTIEDLTSETMYSVRVRANCGDGYSSWSEEIIFETAADCQMSDGLAAANITSRSAVISWNGYGQDYFNLRYGTDGETWTTESKVANPYTLNQLEPATTYYVQVQPYCAEEEEWSDEYIFTTECEAMTITATEPFTEGFEDITGTHIYSETNGIVPTCWESYSEGSVYPHITNSGSYYYVHEGTGTMYFKGEAGTNSYLALPIFTNDLSTLMVSFWMQTENASSGTLSLGYITDEDVDYNSYQVIKTYNNATSMVQRQTVLGYSNIPSNATRLVFRWQYTGTSWYGACIDDVRVAVTETLTKDIAGVGANNWDDENGGYYLIASPVANELDPVDVGMIDAEGDYDLYFFNQAQADEWRNYKADNFNLTSGKGYLYANKADVTLTFIGEPVDGNEKTIYLDYTEGTEFAGWNLVGNPFTQDAYLDKDFYVLNDTRNEVIAAADMEQPIAPMEGVFVYAESENDSVTIDYTPSYKSGSLALNLNQGRGVVDRAVVKFGQGSLPKFQLNPNHTKVYIPQDGKDYAVVSAEAMGEMPVNFKAENNGTYSLSFTSQEVNFAYLHLIDNMTGNDVNLLETPSYTFNASTTDYASRFRLVFATGDSIDGENFSFVNAAGNLCIFGIEGEATVQVVDVLGHVLSSETFSGSYEKSLNAAPGVYMIRLINGNDVKVQKIVVR